MRSDNDQEAGVVLHISSLPGRFGIGEIGAQARSFVDSLRRMNMRIWQFLPLGPTAYGDSPYQPLSTFAGNEMLIDIQDLITRGLLAESEVSALCDLPADSVDYGALIPLKLEILALACKRFQAVASEQEQARLEQFIARHDRAWLNDYALFRLLKSRNEERAWYEWDAAYANRDVETLRALERDFEQQLMATKITQFLFFDQWLGLRNYANAAGVRLFGDMPIYIARDSADAWAHRELLSIDTEGNPKNVAGVPPDYFSEDGQLWGNPLYDWDFHAATGYEWWIERLRTAIEFADIVRIDHFRGFESYWSIPADSNTARNGTWKPGPGDAIFEAFAKALGSLPIIAEDLGLITPEVEALRDRHHLTGMAVLQFMLCDHDFDLGSIARNRVCYTGTHDNDTTLGWFRGSTDDPRSADEIRANQDTILYRSGGTAESVSIDIIKLALASPARIAIAPMQDILSLGSEARMNTPATMSGNWRWRMQSEHLSAEVCDNMAQMIVEFGRTGSVENDR